MAGWLSGRSALAALGEVDPSDEKGLSLRRPEQGRAVAAFLGEGERGARTGTGRWFRLGRALGTVSLHGGR